MECCDDVEYEYGKHKKSNSTRFDWEWCGIVFSMWYFVCIDVWTDYMIKSVSHWVNVPPNLWNLPNEFILRRIKFIYAYHIVFALKRKNNWKNE